MAKPIVNMAASTIPHGEKYAAPTIGNKQRTDHRAFAFGCASHQMSPAIVKKRKQFNEFSAIISEPASGNDPKRLV
ncbi:MAG: hypothetical protein LKI92_08295 [Schleiferilactobacillus harbinensis]|nr:hypothetical protein [Schleiferilactobacillus harbinensis]MCI1911716.1 hypothetical protein [Schleiferilactobacillus harbinensis]